MEQQKTFIQQIEVGSDKVVEEVRKLYEDASAKRVILKDSQGNEILTLPLTVGVGGAALTAIIATPLAAVAAVAGLVANVKLEIERVDTTTRPDGR